MKVILASFFILVLVTACKNENTNTVKKVEISFTKQGALDLVKKDTDSVYKTIEIEIADTEYKTETGLMYRDSMEENQGMLFIFPDSRPRSFYMKNTRIGLDILYFNENKELVSFQKNAKPFDESSLPSGVNAQYVLEINAGLSDVWNITIGDKIQWNRN